MTVHKVRLGLHVYLQDSSKRDASVAEWSTAS